MLAAAFNVRGPAAGPCAVEAVSEAAFLQAVTDSDHAAHTKMAVLEELRATLHSTISVRSCPGSSMSICMHCWRFYLSVRCGLELQT